jgi:hypothetical protein
LTGRLRVETKENIPVSELLSITDAARLIGCQRPNLYYLFRRGDVEYVEVGGRRFVPLPEVRRYRQARNQRGHR